MLSFNPIKFANQFTYHMQSQRNSKKEWCPKQMCRLIYKCKKTDTKITTPQVYFYKKINTFFRMEIS